MTSSADQQPSAPDRAAAPADVVVKRRRGPSIVWLIPLVAALIGVYLVWVTFSQRGPGITIAFQSASGVEAGKTQIKFKDVEVGQVESVRLSDDLSQILVTARMGKGTERHLTEGAQFWVVMPRIGATGVSGLETVVSGSYIELDPGPVGAPAQRSFVGLTEPPLIRSDVPGTRFDLRADTMGSLSRGAPIYYRGIEVGQVLGSELLAGEQEINFPIFIRAPHDKLVHTDSRFWNVSGVSVSAGANGFKLDIASLQALVAGGVTFDTPPATTASQSAPQGQIFRLFRTFEDVSNAAYTQRIQMRAYFDGSVRGLKQGAPVEVKGLEIGRVIDVRLEFEPVTNQIRIPVSMEIEPQRISVANSGPPPKEDANRSILKGLVARGMRAQLRTGSLLTGDLVVALDFFPDAQPAEIRMEGDLPVIPSVPTQLDSITASVQGVLDRVSSLPVEPMIADIRRTVQGIEGLVASPETKEAAAALNASLVQLKELTTRLSGEVEPTSTALRQSVQQLAATMREAQQTLQGAQSFVGPDSQVQRDLLGLLRELQTAARSIRVFADYLERNPQALIRGKGAPQR
ncbi:MAG TPA: MlaD family protein [Geminicoccaceae bacterium]|nr:MlaD family protein [Geminicoccus sp.]HMU48892.1 MlaD family protein [Geminicoccaceae bacterium]